jgi:hypothetical protein
MQNFCFCFNALGCKVITFVLEGENESESCRTTPTLTIYIYILSDFTNLDFNVIIFKRSHVIKISGRVTVFRCVRKAAKRDYQLRHVCPPTRMEQLGFCWMHFGKVVYWDPLL